MAAPKSAHFTRILVFGVLVAAAIYAKQFLVIPDCATIQRTVSSWGLFAPAIYIGAYILACVLFLPGFLLTVLAGMIFGPWVGTAIVSVGSVGGAVAAFLIARYLARDSVEKMLSKQAWFTKFRGGLQENGFQFVLFVRLVPLFPFSALNFACGLVPLTLRDYTLGSFIGMLPGTFAYVYAGNAVGCALIEGGGGGLPTELKIKLAIAIGLLATLAVLPILLKKFRAKGLPTTGA